MLTNSTSGHVVSFCAAATAAARHPAGTSIGGQSSGSPAIPIAISSQRGDPIDEACAELDRLLVWLDALLRDP